MCGKTGGGGHGAMGIAGIAGKAGREDGEGVSLEIGEIAPGKTRRSDGHGWKGWGRGKGRSKGTFRCQREPEDSQQETPNRGGILAGLVKAWNSQISSAAGDGHSPDSRGSPNTLSSG